MGQDTYLGELREPLAQHLYAYVENNPVNRVDPTGHCAMMIDDGNGYGACAGGSNVVGYNSPVGAIGASLVGPVMVRDPLAGTNFGWGVPRGDTVLEIRDLTAGRIKNGVPVGKPMLRVDRPHPGFDYPHVNTEGIGTSVIANHTEISPGLFKMVKNADTIAQVARTAQTGLVVVAVAADGYELYGAYNADGQSIGPNTAAAAGGIAGSWAGAWAGAEAMAAGGAALGTAIAPGPGTVVGGLVGGIVGGIGVALGGRGLGRWLVGLMYE